MLSVALAIAPGIAICLFIYSLNKYGKAPMGSLVACFLLGMAATLPPFAVQMLSEDVRNDHYSPSILSYAWYAFGVVALTEEGSKWLVLRCYAFPKKSFAGPFDGIVYGVMTGMGFATIENIEYVWQFGYGTGLARFFLSVPAHASFAVLMGYNLGLAKSGPGSRMWLMAKGLLIAVLFHGSFDFFLFLQQSREATRYVSTGLLSFGSFATFYIAVRLAMRAIRMHRQEEDEEE
ncbi:MAG TPA: PrsW family glutamic-type intramembrane protease [Puia sp.]|nr:PrsW family glutamic-type intramembrane protease [Puia sp.]